MAHIGQWDCSISRNYNYSDAAGKDVDIYVIDSGLVITYLSFKCCAKFFKNLIEDSLNKDFFDYRTYVTEIIDSSKYRVAKKVNIYAIKVVRDNSTSDISIVIKGI